MSKLIALLTDFGQKDGYVGIMKGVIYNICSDARIVDITHQVEPCNIESAAWILGNSYNYFEDNTIFVTIVDPGVGTNRDIILVKTDRHYFLAPDNGLLTYIMEQEKNRTIIKIENENYWLSNTSSTFHGRDIFAPIAAHLARENMLLDQLGKKIDYNRICKIFIKNPLKIESKITGSIVYIDHFGNLITNIPSSLLSSDKIELQYKNTAIRGLYNNYQDTDKGNLLSLVGSHGFVEIAANSDSAKEILKASIGAEISLICLYDS